MADDEIQGDVNQEEPGPPEQADNEAEAEPQPAEESSSEGEGQGQAEPQEGESPEEEQKPKKRWVGCLVLLLVAGLVLLVALVAVAPSIASSAMVRDQVAGVASEALQRDVSIGELSLGWTSGFRLGELKVKEKSGECFVSLKAVTCDYRVMPLVGGDVVVKELRVVEPQIYLRRDKDGKLNIDDLMAPSDKPAPPPPPSPGPSGPMELPNVELHARIENALFSFEDEAAGETVEVKNFNTNLDMSSVDDGLKVSVDFDLVAKGRTEHVSLKADAKFAQDNLVDPQKAKVNLTFDSVPLQALAQVDMQALSGGSEAKGGEITIDCDIAKLMSRIGAFLPKGLNAEGTIKTVIAIAGTTQKPNVQGSTVLSQIRVTLPPSGEGKERAKPVSLGPLALTIHHDAEYDVAKQAAKIARLNVESDFLNVLSSGNASDLDKSCQFDYGVKVDADLDKIAKMFAAFVPPEVTLSGKSAVNVKASGTAKAEAKANEANPFAMLGQIAVQAQARVDHVKYDTAGTHVTISNLSVDELTLKDGLLKLSTLLKINDGPTNVKANVSFQQAEPTFDAAVDARNVGIDQQVALLKYIIPILILPEDGKIHTSANLNVTAKGESFAWEKLREQLIAKGQLKLNEGAVSGGEIVTKIMKFAGEGDTLKFKGMNSAFQLAKGKVTTDGIQVNGQGLDFVLTGWTSIIPDAKTGGFPMEYKAGSELLKKYAGKDYQKYASLLSKPGESYSPLLIAGTVQEPKVRLNLPSIKDAAKTAITGALGEALGGKKSGDGKAGSLGDQLKKKAGKDLLKGLLGGKK